MLTLFDRDTRGNRRSFLRVGGAVALGAGARARSLADLAALRADAGTMPGLLTGKSVSFLFLYGGPSEVERFDPKMAMPEGTRSATGEVVTRLRCVTFGASSPRLAVPADRLTLVCSCVPGGGDHDIKPVVGRDSFGANLGSILTRAAGPNHPVTGLPLNYEPIPGLPA
jgi:hypothetical protein